MENKSTIRYALPAQNLKNLDAISEIRDDLD